MRNNKSGAGKIAAIIISIVVIAAIAAIIIYRNNVINNARNEAIANVESFDTSAYDGDELNTIEGYVADAKSKLEACKDKDSFQGIVDEFNKNVAEVKTTEQKEEEKAAAEAEAAKKRAAKKGKDSNGCVGGGSDNFY